MELQSALSLAVTDLRNKKLIKKVVR
jgi:hypothetical protein